MGDWLVGLAAVLALGASPGPAAKRGETLYVKSRDARLLARADPKARPVAVLQPGQAVVWRGPDKANPMFHAVEVGGKAGFTLQQNLTPTAPAPDGPAARALSEAALRYAGERPELLTLAKGVLTVEGVAARVDPAKAQQYVVRQTGGGR
jgi:hypothetical protein